MTEDHDYVFIECLGCGKMLPVAFTYEMDRTFCNGCDTVMEITISKKDQEGTKEDENDEDNRTEE